MQLPTLLLRSFAGRLVSTILIGMQLFGGAVALAASHPDRGSGAEPIPVHIGYPQTNYWPLYVARDLKLFEQVGLAPTFHPFSTGAPLMSGMQSGRLDVAWTGLATVYMLGKGIPLRFVLVPIDHSSQMHMVVNPRAQIASYKDLKKSHGIGTPEGTCGQVSAVLAARKAGVPIAELNLVNLAPNLLQGALQNDQIDTAFIWGPWDLQLRAAGFSSVSADKDFVPGGSVCGVTVAIRPAYLEQHPGLGCKMIKVHALALAAARAQPELAIRAIQKASGLSYALARESFETLEIPPIASQLDPQSAWSLTNQDGGLSKKLLLAAEALYEAKSFAQPLSKETVWHAIDARYIRQFIDNGCTA